MYQGSSSAACLGGNITSSSGRTSWSTAVVVMRVRAVQGVVVDREVAADIHPAFELCESLMETVCLHAVFDALQGFIFPLNFGPNGLLVNFELGAALVVATVPLHFGIGGRVVKATC